MKRGASLVWTIVLCGALLFIATSMATATINELNMSSRIDDSSRAYAAAQSGIEYGKYFLDNCSKAGNCSSATPFTKTINITELEGATKYKVTISDTGDGKHYQVLSLGTSNQVNRELQYTIDISGSGRPSPVPDSDVLNTTKRYAMDNKVELDFDYWVDTGQDHYFGFKNDSDNNYLYVHFNTSPAIAGNNLELVEKHMVGGALTTTTGVVDVSTNTSPLIPHPYSYQGKNTSSSDFDAGFGYRYLIKLDYSKAIGSTPGSATLTVFERDLRQTIGGAANLNYFKPTICVGSVTLSNITNKPDDLSSFYIGPGAVASSLFGGSQIQVGNVASYAHIDNVYQMGLTAASPVTVSQTISPVPGGGMGGGSYTISDNYGNLLVNCDSSCASETSNSYYFKNGTALVIKASPNSTSGVTMGPSGGATVYGAAGASQTFNTSAPANIQVAFQRVKAQLTIWTDKGTGVGTVTFNDGQGTPPCVSPNSCFKIYSASPYTVTSLTATPSPGNTFDGWYDYFGNRVAAAGVTTLNNVTVTDHTFSAKFTNANWISGPVSGIQVYYTDISGKSWGTVGEDCKTTKHIDGVNFDCNSSGILINSAGNYATYPAQQACIAIGGRLPTATEMTNIINNGASYNSPAANNYWISSQFDSNFGGSIQRSPIVNGGTWKSGTTNGVRCVK